MTRIIARIMMAAACLAAATTASAQLAAVGPIDPANGYPYYYEDQAGMRLELCLDFASGMCILEETSTPVFPTNWATEHFWYMANADFDSGTNGPALDAAGNKRRLFEMAVEATFGGSEAIIDGNQISFTRLRIRFDNLVTGADYTFEFPHGEITLTAELDPGSDTGRGEINFTDDVGIAALGDFSGALFGNVKPHFLVWDTFGTGVGEPPLGFIGDPAVPHTVTGGVNGFNRVRISGPDIGGTGLSVMETDLFLVMGKLATKNGAELTRATYQRKASGAGFLNLFAKSGALQQLNAVRGAASTPMAPEAGSGRYTARLPFDTTVPTVTIVNVTDEPDTASAAVTPVDEISVLTAEFAVTNSDGSGVLTVKAASSDESTTDPALLSVWYIKDPNRIENPVKIADLASGVLANHALGGAPAFVEIQSSKGGRITVPVRVLGPVVSGPVVP